MSDVEYNRMRKRHCETLVRDMFHLHLPVDELLFDDITTGPSSYAVLFRSGSLPYALFIDEKQRQTLGDVKAIMSHMGITPNKVLPPHADPDYFAREAKLHCDKAFPAIKITDPTTIKLHQRFVAYSPGLVRIDAVTGPVQRYIPKTSRWQQAFEYSFQRIPVA